ncbi:MAG: hypothetical protein NXI12_04045 [Alphaproteobacteria bacterium]|nr:hypothetical protein [Alphaproteobacteria bacterium]
MRNCITLISTFALTATVFGLCAPAAAAQYSGISSTINAAERRCTFSQTATYEHVNEQGRTIRRTSRRSILDRDCVSRQFNGVVVQQNLTFDRANSGALDGAVVVFRGNGFTAYCRGDRDFVRAFERGARRGEVYTVRANFGRLRPEWTTDVELRNCILPR